MKRRSIQTEDGKVTQSSVTAGRYAVLPLGWRGRGGSRIARLGHVLEDGTTVELLMGAGNTRAAVARDTAEAEYAEEGLGFSFPSPLVPHSGGPPFG